MGIDEPVTLATYDPLWPDYFALEKLAILTVLSDEIGDIEHIGSTAIPGLVSKPIIDIQIGVPRLPMSDNHIRALESLEYEYLGEAGVPGRIYFRKRGNRSFNIAVVEWNGRIWKENLLLRDFLLSHPEYARRYVEVKQATISAGTTHLLEYSARKNAIIAEMLEKAHHSLV